MEDSNLKAEDRSIMNMEGVDIVGATIFPAGGGEPVHMDLTEPVPEMAASDVANPIIVADEGAESEDEIIEQANDIPDFAKPSDYIAENNGAGEAGGLLNLHENEEIEPVETPAADAKELAQALETQAPADFELPEKFLPVGTDIHIEQKGTLLFKLPGQLPVIGRGRTIYGAMLDAGLIK